MKSSRWGFTLIELMFVTFLFLLIASFSAAAFRRSFLALEEREAVQDLLGLMTLAHERAIFERQTYGVHVDPTHNQFWLVREEGSTPTRVAGTWGRTHSWPKSMTAQGPATPVMFYPDGTTDPTTLALSSRDHHTLITMDPVSGKGRIHENE